MGLEGRVTPIPFRASAATGSSSWLRLPWRRLPRLGTARHILVVSAVPTIAKATQYESQLPPAELITEGRRALDDAISMVLTGAVTMAGQDSSPFRRGAVRKES